jgi:hypothetical protein
MTTPPILDFYWLDYAQGPPKGNSKRGMSQTHTPQVMLKTRATTAREPNNIQGTPKTTPHHPCHAPNTLP